MKNFILIFIICFSWSYNGPEDEAGDVSAIRTSFMDGNRVLLMFENTTQLSDWEAGGLDYVSIWPNDGTGTRMVDGIGLLVGGIMTKPWLPILEKCYIPDIGDLLTRFSGITVCSIMTGVIWIGEPDSIMDVILYDNLHVFLWVGGLIFALRGNRLT